jgi:hypothetical protein
MDEELVAYLDRRFDEARRHSETLVAVPSR